jgi:hypothetical protein
MPTTKAYIDIRLEATLETEDYGDGDSYTSIKTLDASVIKAKNIPADALYSLYESFGQSDRWQEWLQSDIPEAIGEYAGQQEQLEI